MKVNPRRFSLCLGCSDYSDGEITDDERTVQWLREVKVPSSRSCFGRPSPIPRYVCTECGEVNFG